MELEAVSTVGEGSPAVTPAASASEPKEVRVVSDKELAERAEADLDAKLSKIVKEAKRERSEDGKYAAKNPSTEEGAAAKALTPDKPDLKAEKTPAKAPDTKPETQKPAEGKTPAETKPEAVKPIEPPKHWSDSAKERFAKLDADTQKELIETTKTERQALTKLGQTVKAFEPVGKVLETFKQTFERRNMSYEQGLEQLLRAQDALDTNPVEAIKKLAAAYRVDLSQLAGVPGQGQPHQLPPDPEVTALKTHIADLERQLGEVSGYVSQTQRQAYESKVNQLSAAIDAFAKDKPDFEDVADQVQANFVQLTRANPGLTYDAALAQAYDAAIWSNPKTREKALADHQRTAEERRLQALEQARAANALNVTSQPAPVEGGDLDDKLRSIARRRAA